MTSVLMRGFGAELLSRASFCDLHSLNSAKKGIGFKKKQVHSLDSTLFEVPLTVYRISLQSQEPGWLV